MATLFGEVVMRLPRFLCAACNRITASIDWPPHSRSTPELQQLQANLSALMTYRVATGVLRHLLPVTAGTSPETLRGHTLQIGERLAAADVVEPTAAAIAITVSLDSTFIRSCEEGERHLEVRVGNVETEHGRRQVFGAVAKAGTDVSALVRRNLDAVRHVDDTEVTAFTDGDPGLRSVLVHAGITKPPILDWFHLAMRFQHAAQSASTLSTDDPAKAQAKAMIVEEVDRLRWRIWNGKAKNASRSIGRIRKVMHLYRGERGDSCKERAVAKAVARVSGFLRMTGRMLNSCQILPVAVLEHLGAAPPDAAAAGVDPRPVSPQAHAVRPSASRHGSVGISAPDRAR